jgi:hypothetical protein
MSFLLIITVVDNEAEIHNMAYKNSKLVLVFEIKSDFSQFV